jgi:hypothetical protein
LLGCGSGSGRVEVVAGQSPTSVQVATTIGESSTTSVAPPTSESSSTSTSEPPTTSSLSTTITEPEEETVDLTEREGIEAIEACVGEWLPEGTDLEAVPESAAEDAVDACSRDLAFGDLWEQSLREQFGSSLSEANYTCLRAGYIRLTTEEVEVISLGGLNPGGEEASAAAALLDGLFGECGL